MEDKTIHVEEVKLAKEASLVLMRDCEDSLKGYVERMFDAAIAYLMDEAQLPNVDSVPDS